MAVGRKPYLWRIGVRYGRLVVTRYVGRSQWECLCDCGRTSRHDVGNLTSGKARSCGCIRAECNTTHDRSKTSEYNVHRMMLQRCYNTNYNRFADYGGRGIKVCDRWRGEKGFSNFLADLGPRPDSNHRLERNDNGGDYTPANCRWATAGEQMRNTRRNVNVTFDGRTMCRKDWAKELGVNPMTLAYRLKHWSLERAMTAETSKHRSAITDGETRCPLGCTT